MHMLTACSYSVVVTTSPQSPISFNVDTITLTCSVTPLPLPPVKYTWTAVPRHVLWYTINSLNSSIPKTTVRVTYNTARHPTYYCHVHSNGSEVAWGQETATIQGCHAATKIYINNIMMYIRTYYLVSYIGDNFLYINYE